MRILFTRFPYQSAHGGAEKQTLWLASGLVKRGHRVRILGQCKALADMFHEIDAVTQYLHIGLPPVTVRLAISFFWRRKSMQEQLIAAIEEMREKPEAIFMLSLSEKLLLTEWAAAQGIKVFWIEHDRIGRWLTKNPWLPLLKRAAKKATMICVSDLSRRMYIELGFDPERVIAIPNGVPFPPPSPGSNSLSTSETSHKLTLGCIARLSSEKGIDILLHAISSIPDIDLTIVGTGLQEAYLRSLISEDTQRIGSQRITLVSRIADLEEFYHSLDVLVLPSSDHDPFGLVAAEAMMRGIATVVTDACGIADYVRSGKDALIAKAGSVESLRSMLTSLRDPVLRKKIAEEAALTAKRRFSLAEMTDAYERALQKTS